MVLDLTWEGSKSSLLWKVSLCRQLLGVGVSHLQIWYLLLCSVVHCVHCVHSSLLSKDAANLICRSTQNSAKYIYHPMLGLNFRTWQLRQYTQAFLSIPKHVVLCINIVYLDKPFTPYVERNCFQNAAARERHIGKPPVLYLPTLLFHR